MSLFKKKARYLPGTSDDVYMANEILKQIGEEVSEHSADVAFSGGRVCYRCYKDYGLTIISYYTEPGIIIEYNDERVLTTSTYTPGLWEEVLKEVYNKRFIIKSNQAEEEATLEKQKEILKKISSIRLSNSKVEIDDCVVITGHDNYFGYENEHYEGTNYTVKYFDDVVFSAYSAGLYGVDKYYKYVPGYWEDHIDKYLRRYKDSEEIEKRNKLDRIASDNIKKLRNL